MCQVFYVMVVGIHHHYRIQQSRTDDEQQRRKVFSREEVNQEYEEGVRVAKGRECVEKGNEPHQRHLGRVLVDQRHTSVA